MPPFEDKLLFNFVNGSNNNHLEMIERTIKDKVPPTRKWFVKVNDWTDGRELFSRSFDTYDEAVKTYISRISALVK